MIPVSISRGMTPPQHSGELRQMNQCPPRVPFVALNQTFALNKTFISWMLINSDNRSAVGGSWNPGTSALIREGQYSLGTDEC